MQLRREPSDKRRDRRQLDDVKMKGFIGGAGAVARAEGELLLPVFGLIAVGPQNYNIIWG